jgi:uncharacterized membrane protein YgcG
VNPASPPTPDNYELSSGIELGWIPVVVIIVLLIVFLIVVIILYRRGRLQCLKNLPCVACLSQASCSDHLNCFKKNEESSHAAMQKTTTTATTTTTARTAHAHGVKISFPTLQTSTQPIDGLYNIVREEDESGGGGGSGGGSGGGAVITFKRNVSVHKPDGGLVSFI